MASQTGYPAESVDDSKLYRRSGSGEQPLAPIPEKRTELDQIDQVPTESSQNLRYTTRQPPPKWELVGLAREKALKTQATSSQVLHSKQTSNVVTSHDSIPPMIPPRRRTSTEIPAPKREVQPPLPPRNTATTAPSKYTKSEPGAAGIIGARKGAFSKDLTKWAVERREVGKTGRFAFVPPTLGDNWSTASETVSLVQFVEKYSNSLPVQVCVDKGYYGSNDPETVGSEEKLIIAYVKSRKLLNIITSAGKKYSLPLGSAVQLSLLYNPSGNEEEALEGYTFQTVGDIVRQTPDLPKIVSATKAYVGKNLKSTVSTNEMLLIKSYDVQARKLEVISIGQSPIKKSLPLQCSGCFTTKPSQVCMYVSDIDRHIGTSASILDLQGVLHLSELKRTSADTPIDQNLEGVVKVSGFVTERSLLATRISEGGSSLKASERKVFEIPVNDDLSEVTLSIVQKDIWDKYLPEPSSFELELELWNEPDTTLSTKTQRLFDEFVRDGLEREGLAYNARCNVYDEPHTPSPSIKHVTPYATQDLLSEEFEQKLISNDHQADIDEEYLDPSTSPVQEQVESTAKDKEPRNDHKFEDKAPVEEEVVSSPMDGPTKSGTKAEQTDLKTVLKSVVSEMLSEYQKILPVHKNPNEEKVTMSKPRLNEVVLELTEIENLWYIFGIRIGVNKSKLDQIYANYGSGPAACGRCFIETISYWENNHENVTWSSIVDALYSMERKQLAKTIAKKHKVMLPDPKFGDDVNDLAQKLKEFVPDDKLAEINSKQQQMQMKGDRLHEVRERLGEYEQTIEEYHNNLMDIKSQLLFNERLTRMLTRENQLLRMKQAHKEKLIKSPSRQSSSDSGSAYDQRRESLKREIHSLHGEQETYESRLHGAHHDTMELQHKLFTIESDMKGIKKHLVNLQEQKYQLTRGLREEECELSGIITGSVIKSDEDVLEDDDEELPQYYNIIRCDGKVEVKLHEEELKMLQLELDRKTAEVGSLKKELESKNERMAQVGSWLAKQECDEMTYSYTDASELNVLEKHQNDHLKTRLQMEKIDCQIQLTKAWLQKRDVEMKLDVVKQCLDMSKDVWQRAQEVFEKSTGRSRSTDVIPPENMDTRSFSVSSTASEGSVFSNFSRSSSLALSQDQTVLPYRLSRSIEAHEGEIQTTESQQKTEIEPSVKESKNSAANEEQDGDVSSHNNGNKNTLALSADKTPVKSTPMSHPRTRSNALAAGKKRSPASAGSRRSTKSSTSSSGSNKTQRLASAREHTQTTTRLPRTTNQTRNTKK